MSLRSSWIKHLKENDMSYIQHFIFASYYGLICLYAGLTLILHSLFPCFYQTTGSDLVSELSKTFKKRGHIDDT